MNAIGPGRCDRDTNVALGVRGAYSTVLPLVLSTTLR